MKVFRGFLLYSVVVGISIGIIFLVNSFGANLHAGSKQMDTSVYTEKGSSLENTLANLDWEKYFHNPEKPFILVLLQLMVIIAVARLFGYIATRIGQQKVIGEIIAGIALGPSFLGNFWPEINAFIFPPYSYTSLYVLSQLGLILFMFIIGMEVDISMFKSKSKQGVFISHSTIAFSAILGFLLSMFLYESFAPVGITYTEFSLFIAVSLSITAFPVMARILQERKMVKTPLGSLMMTIAAMDDVTAWCLLAAVVGLVSSSSITGALITIALMVVYVALMFLVVRPILAKYLTGRSRRSDSILFATGMAFMVLLCSSFATRFIGVHALFGAFVAGIVMPERSNFREIVSEKVRDLSTLLLLPVFFTLAGLRAHIEMLNGSGYWILLIVVLTAMFGKVIGGSVFARISRLSWADSLRVGVLLNTRGLMEIIVLNIGLDLNVIDTEIYTIFLLMALVTTLTTSPLLNFLDRILPSGNTTIPETGEGAPEGKTRSAESPLD